MSNKEILVVDDDQRVLHYLQRSLETMGEGYNIIAVNSAKDVLNYVQTSKPDLVISDLRMPDVNGLELLKLIRAMHSDAKLVLMTAYGTEKVQEAAKALGVYRFITKPFRTENLVSIARSALNADDNIAVGADGILIIPEQCLLEINEVLLKLRVELRPDLAIMADMAGHVVTHVGTTMGLDVNSIVALVAGNFATAGELDSIFERAKVGETVDLETDKPIYYATQEGVNYDSYSANVGNNLFFTVIFNRRDAKNKAGMVWLNMRRTFRELQIIINKYSDQIPKRVLQSDQETVTKEFDQLFSNEMKKSTS